LIEYIEPFLAGTENYQEYSNFLKIAVMSWNMALVSEEERQKLLKKLFPGNSSDPEEIEDEKEVQRIVKKLIKRKLKFFAEEERFITDFKLTENSGRFHISVASSFKM
jgi:coenzyme F420-reducing hydrogenase beta subunit